MVNALGAHIYAGGFTLGVAQHFNVLGHLEHEAYGADVIRLNFPGLPVYAGGPKSWPTSWPNGRGRVRFMYANPPCAIWSVSTFFNSGHDWRDDPRLPLHHDIFNYAMDVVAPDVLVIESVPPSFTKGREHIEAQIRQAETYGYATTCIHHNTQWLGVPQARRRVFYMFHKVAIPWEYPDFQAPTTVRQAFKGLPKKSSGYPIPELSETIAKYLKLTPPGGSLEKAYTEHNPDPPVDHRGWRKGAPSTLARRLPWDKPAPVALYPFHPSETRRLTQEEAAAICTFPQTYKWPTGSCDKMAGFMNRGIMPKAAEWLARQVYAGLEKNSRLNDLTPMVFDVAKPPGSYYTLSPQTVEPKEGMPMARAAQPATPRPQEGEGSGAFIRRMLTAGMDDDAILEAVHANYEDSKAKKADISWNRGRLKKENGETPAPRKAAAPKKAAAVQPLPAAPPKRRGRPPASARA